MTVTTNPFFSGLTPDLRTNKKKPQPCADISTQRCFMQIWTAGSRLSGGIAFPYPLTSFPYSRCSISQTRCPPSSKIFALSLLQFNSRAPVTLKLKELGGVHMSLPEPIANAGVLLCQGTCVIRTFLFTFDLQKLSPSFMPGHPLHPREQQGQHLLPLQLQEQLCLEEGTWLRGCRHFFQGIPWEQAPRMASRNQVRSEGHSDWVFSA